MRVCTVLALLPLWLTGCEYEAIVDPDASTLDNVITGTVVVSGLDEPATTMVLVFPGNNPPPPAGTGRPLNLATVTAADFTYAQTDGTMSAPYTITGLPDGDYILTALVDVDGNFHPRVDALSSSTCGDMLGAHVTDLANPQFAVVNVQGGTLTENISLFVATRNNWEPPAFMLEAGGNVSRSVVSPQLTILSPVSVSCEINDINLQLPGPYVSGENTCQTTFLIDIKDENLDGIADSDPSNPAIYNVWPKVYFSYLGDTDIEGESWLSQGFYDPVWVESGAVPFNTPTPSSVIGDELVILWVPSALRTYPAATQEECQGSFSGGLCQEVVTSQTSIPTGSWAITVVQETGQTWTVPNGVSVCDETQAAVMTVNE